MAPKQIDLNDPAFVPKELPFQVKPRTYHYICTLGWNAPGGGTRQGTWSGIFTPDSGTTYEAAYDLIVKITAKWLGIMMPNPTVLFFDLRPNDILR